MLARPYLLVGMTALVVLAGAAQAWTSRFALTADGVSYIDMAEALSNAEWTNAVNSYWSPLYAGLLSLPLAIVSPGPELTLPLVHAVNFAVYLFALAGFALFLQELLLHRRQVLPVRPKDALSERTLVALGLGIFAFAGVRLIGLNLVTPDLLLAGLLFVATALLLRSQRSPTIRTLVLLGLVLGLSYLAKAASFFLAFAFIATAGWLAPTWKAGIRRAGVTAVSFAVLAIPWIAVLSVDTQRLTFGESGRLNYLWATGEAPMPPYLSGDPGSERLLHVPVKISQHPPAYTFLSPVPGTLPLWYDPGYWYRGVTVDRAIADQVGGAMRKMWKYVVAALVAAAALVLALNALRPSQLSPRALARSLRFLAPVLIAIGLYLLIHVRARYIGGHLAILAIGLISMVALPTRRRWRALHLSTAIAAGVIMLLAMGATMRAAAVPESPGAAASRGHVEAALALQELGFDNGDRAAVLGGRLAPLTAYWALLADMKVIGLVTHPHTYVSAPERRRKVLNERLARAGAKVLVTDEPRIVGKGWRRLGSTQYHALPL